MVRAGRGHPYGGGRSVPADVLNAQHRHLRAVIPRLHTEGFAEILIHE
jgi:hypothetical protein